VEDESLEAAQLRKVRVLIDKVIYTDYVVFNFFLSFTIHISLILRDHVYT